MGRPQFSPNLIGAFYAFASACCFSFVELLVKFISDDYALHQAVLYRSVVGMVAFCVVFLPFNGWLNVFRTRRLGAHLFRGLCVVLANSFLFMGLAAMPIADAVAIYFVAPLVTAVMFVIFLREQVGLRRWIGIAVGLAGVLLVVRPGTSAFQLASLFPALAACLYATMHITARFIRDTDNAVTMTAYTNLIFLIVSASVGLAIGDGRFSGQVHPDLEFLFRAWAPVNPDDIVIFVAMGLAGVTGALLITQAYRMSEAAFAAPMEYISIPLAILYGALIFGTFPDGWTWVGIGLILTSGLYLVWREAQKGRVAAAAGVRNEGGVRDAD